MIEFKKFPPESPEDVVLSGAGLQILQFAAVPRRLRSAQLSPFRASEFESRTEVGVRLQTLGLAIGSTIADALEHSNNMLAMQIGGHVAEQYRSTLDLNQERWKGQDFGSGVYTGIGWHQPISSLNKAGELEVRL